MAVEEQLELAKQAVERKIKLALINKSMTQTDLAKLIGESKSDVNKAVKGGTLPKDKEIRKKIYQVLGIKQIGKARNEKYLFDEFQRRVADVLGVDYKVLLPQEGIKL